MTLLKQKEYAPTTPKCAEHVFMYETQGAVHVFQCLHCPVSIVTARRSQAEETNASYNVIPS